MLQSLVNLFQDYWGWLMGIAGLSAVLSWIPGGGVAIGIIVSALKMVAAFFESISPLIGGIFQGLIWLWQKIIWPGLLDILDSWATILTVLICAGGLYFFLLSKYEIKHFNDQRQLTKCYAELKGAKRNLPEPEPEIGISLPWPFTLFK